MDSPRARALVSRAGWTWLIWTMGGFLIVAASLFVPVGAPAVQFLPLVVDAGLVVAFGVALARHRPVRSMPWLLLGAGSCSVFAGNVLWYVARAGLIAQPGFPSVADPLFLVGYLVLGTGLGVMVTRGARRWNRGRPVDTVIVVGGTAVL